MPSATRQVGEVGGVLRRVVAVEVHALFAQPVPAGPQGVLEATAFGCRIMVVRNASQMASLFSGQSRLGVEYPVPRLRSQMM